MSPDAILIYHNPKHNEYALYYRGMSMTTGWCTSLQKLITSKLRNPVTRDYFEHNYPTAKVVATTTDLATLHITNPELFI